MLSRESRVLLSEAFRHFTLACNNNNNNNNNNSYITLGPRGYYLRYFGHVLHALALNRRVFRRASEMSVLAGKGLLGLL